MATQTVEFAAPTGMSLTAKLSVAGSDTITASVAATEATNRKGTYTVAYTDVAAGTYRLTTADGVCVWWVDLLLATGTYQAYERTVQTGDSFARIGAAGAGLTAVGVATNADKTGYSLTATTGLGNQTANITGTITTATNLTNLPAITAGWLTAAGIAASALDGKGNWNIGKTGYSLTAGTGLGNQTADITGSLSGSVGSVTGAVGSVTGAVGSINSGGITTASFAAGAINAAAIAGNAIGASELATDAVTEIANAVAAQITTDHGTGSYLTATGFSTHSAADVWAVGSRTLTAFGFTVTTADAGSIASILADTNELQTDWVNGGRLDLILDARASQSSVDDLPTNAELTTALAGADDATLAAIAAEAIKTAAIKAKTDNLPSDPADQSAVEAAITSAVSTLATSANQTVLIDGIGFITAQLMGACSDAGTSAETFQITFGGSTYTLDFVGLDATGNRTSVARTKT